MNVRFIIRFCSVALTVVYLSACATVSAPAVDETPPPSPAALPDEVAPDEATDDETTDADRSAAYFLYLSGLASERAGQYHEAIGDFIQATTFDPLAVQAYERAAGLLLRVGDLASAMEVAEKGLAVDPQYTPLLGLLGGVASSLSRHAEARDYFSRIIAIDPTRQDAWIYWAVAAFHDGDEEGALVILDDYLKRFPDDPRGYYYKGRVLGKLARYDEAEKLFKNLIATFPDHAKGYEALGLLYRAQGRFDDAVKVYKRYIKRRPEDEEMRSRLAETYVLKEEYGDAISEYEDLLKFEPEGGQLRMKLAATHLKQAESTGDEEEYKKALRELQLIRAENPENREATFYVATIFERLGLVDEAVEMWQALVTPDDPASRDIYLKIAELYERSDRTEQALTYTEKALAVTPEDPELYYFHGLLLEKAGRLAEAAEAFNAAIDRHPREEKYYFYLGVTLEKMKDYDGCMEAMRQVLKLSPDHANALNYLGYLYADRGVRLDEAEDLVRRALALEPDNGYFIDSLAWVYFKQKKYDAALEHAHAAIRNIPPDPTVFDHMGDIYRAMNRLAAAAAAYERSLAADAENEETLDREGVRKKLESVRRQLDAAP